MTTPRFPTNGPDNPALTLSRDELKAATVSGARWMAATRLIAEAGGFGSMLVMARLVPPRAFGLAVIVLVLPTLASTLSFEGFGAALVQRQTVHRRHLEAAFLCALVFGLMLTAAVFFLAPLLADRIFGPGASGLMRIGSPAFAIASLGTVPRAMLQRTLAWATLNINDLVGLVVTSLSSVVLAVFGLDAEAVVIGALIGAAVMALSLLWRVQPPMPRWHRREVGDVIRFGGPAALAGLAGTLRRNIDYLVLGALLSANQVGYYWRAFQLGVEYQNKVGRITVQVSRPILSRAEHRDDLRFLRSRVIRANVTILYPLLATLIALGSQIIPLLYGDDWAPAAPLAQVLAVAGMAGVLTAGFEGPILAVGRPSALAAFNLVSLAMVAIAAWLSAPYGLTVVVVAMVCVAVLMLAISQTLLNRLAGIPLMDLVTDVVPALASCAALVVVQLALSSALGGIPAAVMLVCAIPAGLGAYVVVLRICFPSAWRNAYAIVARARERRVPAPAR